MQNILYETWSDWISWKIYKKDRILTGPHVQMVLIKVYIRKIIDSNLEEVGIIEIKKTSNVWKGSEM